MIANIDNQMKGPFDCEYCISMKSDAVLNRFIAHAKGDYERALAEYTRIKSTGRKKTVGQAHSKTELASSRVEFYERLTKASHDSVLARLGSAVKLRQEATRHEHSNPVLAKSLLEAAHSDEQAYLLWCDFHGKTPRKDVAHLLLKQPAEPLTIHGRGGRRPGAGRPAVGHVGLFFNCSPETAEKVRALAKASGSTLGEWLNNIVQSISEAQGNG